jgi:predicted GNAT family acetyltransferase
MLNSLEMLGGVFSIGEEFSGEENGAQSYLLYEHVGLPKSKMVAFSHTWTPENERGKGIGKAITRAALEWAKVKGYTVLPTCSFVKKFAEDNIEEDFVKGVVSDMKGSRVISNNVKM